MNKWIGIGRLTRDPEVRYSNNNNEAMCIARYSLAIDRVKEGTDYISCVAFGKQGEFAEKYLKQGVKIAVEGRIQIGSYTNKEGQKIYTTDVVVERHEFCEKREKSVKPEQASLVGFLETPTGENNLPFK
jgi:single-strand DNA-binding protein